MTFQLWLGRPGEEVLREGTAREMAEQTASESHDQVVAPPCPVCGLPVSDRAWEDHKYSAHGVNDDCLPYGKADSRELFIPAFSRDDLERKKSAWRARHPGLSLALAGEGTRAEGKIVWQKFRVLDASGKAVR